MSVRLGRRDEQRFAAVSEEERDYLLFKVEFVLGILEQRPTQLEALQGGAEALTALGYYEDGLALDKRLERLLPEDPLVIYNLACSLALAKRSEEALASLEKAIDLGYRDRAHMQRDPDLTSLRDDPRFQSLLTRAAADPPEVR